MHFSLICWGTNAFVPPRLQVCFSFSTKFNSFISFEGRDFFFTYFFSRFRRFSNHLTKTELSASDMGLLCDLVTIFRYSVERIDSCPRKSSYKFCSRLRRRARWKLKRLIYQSLKLSEMKIFEIKSVVSETKIMPFKWIKFHRKKNLCLQMTREECICP